MLTKEKTFLFKSLESNSSYFRLARRISNWGGKGEDRSI